jgi:hypothetical protein
MSIEAIAAVAEFSPSSIIPRDAGVKKRKGIERLERFKRPE